MKFNLIQHKFINNNIYVATTCLNENKIYSEKKINYKTVSKLSKLTSVYRKFPVTRLPYSS